MVIAVRVVQILLKNNIILVSCQRFIYTSLPSIFIFVWITVYYFTFGSSMFPFLHL